MKQALKWITFILICGISLQTGMVYAEKKIRWKMASAYPATLPILGTGGQYLSKQIKLISSDKVRIKFFEPNKLIPPLSIFDAVSTGSVDAGWSASGMWIGKMPASPLFSSIPFGPDLTEYLAWIYEGGGLTLWRELYAPHHVVPIPCAVLPPEASGWFRKPIDNIEDLRGLKIRFYGIGGKVLQKLGASVQLLAGGDIFPAMARGVLDATEYSMPTLDEKLGLYRVAKYYYFPGWHQQTSIIELIVNQDKWNQLNQQQQGLIETVCKDVIVKTFTEGEAMQGAALKRMVAKGVQLKQWSPEIIQAFRQTTQQVLQEESLNDKDFDRTLKSLTVFRQQYANWKKRSRIE